MPGTALYSALVGAYKRKRKENADLHHPAAQMSRRLKARRDIMENLRKQREFEDVLWQDEQRRRARKGKS